MAEKKPQYKALKRLPIHKGAFLCDAGEIVPGTDQWPRHAIHVHLKHGLMEIVNPTEEQKRRPVKAAHLHEHRPPAAPQESVKPVVEPVEPVEEIVEPEPTEEPAKSVSKPKAKAKAKPKAKVKAKAKPKKKAKPKAKKKKK